MDMRLLRQAVEKMILSDYLRIDGLECFGLVRVRLKQLNQEWGNFIDLVASLDYM